MLSQSILHLDDSRIALKLLANAFKGHAKIIGVSDLESARCALKSSPDIACFILDNHLVDGSGLEFIKDIRRHETYKTVPIIMFTSTLTNSVAHKAMTYGVNQSLPKVIGNDDLIREVMSQIANPRIKVVAKEYHEVQCAAWKQGDLFYQYSPDTQKTVSAASPEAVHKLMEIELRKVFKAESYNDYVSYEIELKKHVIYTPHGVETDFIPVPAGKNDT